MTSLLLNIMYGGLIFIIYFLKNNKNQLQSVLTILVGFLAFLTIQFTLLIYSISTNKSSNSRDTILEEYQKGWSFYCNFRSINNKGGSSDSEGIYTDNSG